MSRPRYRVNLEDWEICLIKGLGDRGMSQQQIIARFSFPHRTVHHNLVSEIVRRETCGSDTVHPPAPPSVIDTFLRYSDGSDGRGLWSLVWSGSHAQHTSAGPLSFTYRYHPVGQGIFCSGRISRRGHPDFRWVYDCGTDNGVKSVKRGDHVRREIAMLKEEHSVTDVPHLDLVTLSHFDTDHLSGMLDLISEFTIGTLLLPYLTPWDRLVVALIEGAAIGSDLLDFLVAPTAFLLERAGEGRIGRILLVQGGGEGPALPPMLPPDESPPGGVERDLAGTLFKDENPPNEDKAGGAGPDPGLASGQVGMLRRGGSITVDRVWEFVPYNDARLAGLANPTFVAKARTLAAQLDRRVPTAARKAALEALNALYVRTFKAVGAKAATAKQRNEISLFLYSGPIGRVELLAVEESILRHRLEPLPAAPFYSLIGSDRFGQIFTGDGYLRTTRQWSNFQVFFCAHDRLRRGAIFQVMHHGSEANWRPEIAATIEPVASIFCSDPAHTLGHPHWPVLDSFSGYNPKQIDLFHGWQVRGIYRFT